MNWGIIEKNRGQGSLKRNPKERLLLKLKEITPHLSFAMNYSTTKSSDSMLASQVVSDCQTLLTGFQSGEMA